MDESVAKVVTDLSFGTGCNPAVESYREREEETHVIESPPADLVSVLFASPQTLEEFQKRGRVGVSAVRSPRSQCWERIWAASVRARSRAISR